MRAFAWSPYAGFGGRYLNAAPVSGRAPGSTEPVTKDPLSGVVSRSTGYAAARMGPRAAEVEALDRRGVPGQERRRAQEAWSSAGSP